GVHRVVTNGIDFSFGITRYQGGVHLLHVLSYEAKLRSALGINLFFVAEGDRFQREDRFACLIHRLDCLLLASGGGLDPNLTVRIYADRRAATDRYSANAGDISSGLGPLRTDADGVGFRRCS